ncbi:MAG: hypothetical protein WA863_03045, partial [Methyloceanibacter sp.]
MDTRTAGLDCLEDWLNFFDFGEAALVDGGSVVDASAAWLEVAPDEERYSSRTQPCSWVIFALANLSARPKPLLILRRAMSIA